jgi:N-acetylmuramoyl-L-alanine amidase
MQIIHHRLYRDDGVAYPFIPSPNFDGEVQPRFLVIHYTAMRNAQSAINWLTNPASKVSSHLVIGRDSSVTQLVPFDKIAWHAGVSQWQGYTKLNRYSIGIELDNAGYLTRHSNRWLSWFEAEYDDSDTIEAVHQHETQPRGWHTFTSEQIETALEVANLLVNYYNLREVLGHDDIAPGRKLDPGPAFPMASFRARLFGA